MKSFTNKDIYLLQADLVTVGAVFDNDLILNQEVNINRLKANNTIYTFKADTTMDLRVGDLAIVDSQGEPKIVRIVEIHQTPQIDRNASFVYRWVIQKLDLTHYQKRISEEKVLEQLLERLTFIEQQRGLKERLAQVQEDKVIANLLQTISENDSEM